MEDKIDSALTEIVELLNDLTWNLKPLGLDDEESTDTEGVHFVVLTSLCVEHN